MSKTISKTSPKNAHDTSIMGVGSLRGLRISEKAMDKLMQRVKNPPPPRKALIELLKNG